LLAQNKHDVAYQGWSLGGLKKLISEIYATGSFVHQPVAVVHKTAHKYDSEVRQV